MLDWCCTTPFSRVPNDTHRAVVPQFKHVGVFLTRDFEVLTEQAVTERADGKFVIRPIGKASVHACGHDTHLDAFREPTTHASNHWLYWSTDAAVPIVVVNS